MTPNYAEEYERRLRQLHIDAFDVSILKDIEVNHPKFDSDGKILPFYGSTCIVWVKPRSELFQQLCALQEELQEALEQAGVRELFSFLEPASFHMTVCDIDASPDHRQVPPFERLEGMQKGLEQIGKVGEIHAGVHGLGLKGTITALVSFADHRELQKVLEIERVIKTASATDVRSFTGHISLAYFVGDPTEKIQIVKETLLPYSDRKIGELCFSEFDLTFFTDMNTFMPLLTVNLLNSTVTRHGSSLQELQSLLHLSRSINNLDLRNRNACCAFKNNSERVF